MLKTKHALLSIALMTAVGPAVQADDKFELSEKLALSGFIDMSWTHSDTDGKGSSQSAGLDQFEVDLLYNLSDALKAQVDIDRALTNSTF